MLDVPHHWNSTHDMILEVVEYKIVLKRYATAQQQPVPEDEEWSKAELVGDFLGDFAAATKSFSANRYPTSHLFLDNVLCIHDALRGQQWQENLVIRDLAKRWTENLTSTGMVIITWPLLYAPYLIQGKNFITLTSSMIK